MPDPVAYLKALLAAAFVSAMMVLVSRLLLRKSAHSMAPAICVLAVGAGLVTGYRLLEFPWGWPPANALNRFLTIVLPAALMVELFAAVYGVRRSVSENARHSENAGRLSWMPTVVLRIVLCASIGRILLHRSVYLSAGGSSNPEAWSVLQAVAILCGSVIALAAAWISLRQLAHRPAPGSISLSLVMCILCGGMTTMLAGYIKGGAAAVPLAAAIAGTTLASPLLCKGFRPSGESCLQGPIGIGLIGLFSLLCIGHFFGQVTILHAIVVFHSPLLCWISEIPGFRPKSVWLAAAIRFFAVAIPLTIVLFFSVRTFNLKMAPLLATQTSGALYGNLNHQPAGRTCCFRADPGEDICRWIDDVKRVTDIGRVATISASSFQSSGFWRP